MIANCRKRRPVGDFYETPAEAVHALLGKESFPGPIWEPACGKGAISRILEQAGHTVFSSDIQFRYGARHDFLTPSSVMAASIITNPPYTLAEQFIRQALIHSHCKVAMLLRLCFLESKTRADLFASTPLSSVLVFRRRLNMGKGDHGTMAFAWFIWTKGYRGKPMLGWL